MKKLLSVLLCVVMIASLFSITAVAADTPIAGAEATVTAPLNGQRPDYTPELAPDAHYHSAMNNTGNSLGDVLWRDKTEDRDMDKYSDVFDIYHSYEVYITLTPDAGYAFAAGAGTVNGQPADYTLDGTKATLHLEFLIVDEVPQQTGDANLTILVPMAGMVPDYFPLSDNYLVSLADYHEGQYSYGVEWFDLTDNAVVDKMTDVFLNGHTYRATLLLEPQTGFYFQKGIRFTVNGQPAEAQPEGELKITLARLTGRWRKYLTNRSKRTRRRKSSNRKSKASDQ